VRTPPADELECEDAVWEKIGRERAGGHDYEREAFQELMGEPSGDSIADTGARPSAHGTDPIGIMLAGLPLTVLLDVPETHLKGLQLKDDVGAHGVVDADFQSKVPTVPTATAPAPAAAPQRSPAELSPPFRNPAASPSVADDMDLELDALLALPLE
jgi:hypothetical protein